MALIHEIRAGQMQTSGGDNGNNNNNNPTDVFLLSMSRQNFQAVLNAVFKMEQYWAGVTNVSQLLEKRLSSTCFLGLIDLLMRVQGRAWQDHSLVSSKEPLSHCLIKDYCVVSAQTPRTLNIHLPRPVFANR